MSEKKKNFITVSKYRGAIYSAIMNSCLFSEDAYTSYLTALKNTFTNKSMLDHDSCLTEVAAAKMSGVSEEAVIPAANIFNIKLPELDLEPVKKLASLFLEEIKVVPKRLLIASILAGVLFASSNMINNHAMDNSGYRYFNDSAYHQQIKEINESILKEESVNLGYGIQKKTVSPYAEAAEGASMRRGIVKALSLANKDLSENSKESYASTIINVSKKFNLNPALVTGVIITESTGKSGQVSSVGASGLMQVMWSVHGPSLNKKFGYTSQDDLHDPVKGITAGCWILKGYIQRSKHDIKRGLGRYWGSMQNTKYYNKVMQWANVVQNGTGTGQYMRDFARAGFTAEEAEAVLNMSVILPEIGALNAAQIVLCIETFKPDISPERASYLAKFLIRHERVADGYLKYDEKNKDDIYDLAHKIGVDTDKERTLGWLTQRFAIITNPELHDNKEAYARQYAILLDKTNKALARLTDIPVEQMTAINALTRLSARLVTEDPEYYRPGDMITVGVVEEQTGKVIPISTIPEEESKAALIGVYPRTEYAETDDGLDI